MDYDTADTSYYEEVLNSGLLRIGKDQLIRNVSQYATGARIIEFACGSGILTAELARLPCRSVVAVDISACMLDKNRERINKEEASVKDKVSFLQADASEPRVLGGGNFDVALGAWFTQNAPNRATLDRMWQMISLNLRPGGVYIELTDPWTDDLSSFLVGYNACRHGSLAWDELFTIIGRTDHGHHVRGVFYKGCKAWICDYYWLSHEATVTSARKAGMTTALERVNLQVSPEYMYADGQLRHDVSKELLLAQVEYPESSIICITKPSQ